MKTLSLAFLLSLLVWQAVGQTDKLITDWKTLDQVDDEFLLEVPEGFKFGMPGLPSNKITARGEFHSDSDRFYLFIDSPKDSNQRKQVEAFLKYSKQATSEMNLAENVAARADFQDSTGYYHHVIFIRTQNRVFTLQTVSLTKNSPNAFRFLNSFRLQPKPVAATVPPPESTEKVDDDPVLVIDLTQTPTQGESRGGGIENGGGQGTGLRSGSGNAQGSGSGIGSGSSAATPPKITVPLKVVYKQKAQYTDFARFYTIQGTVTLRVTFLATGQIGSVTTIKKLPFGLTESAIFAAQNMRFEPEVANGLARNTTRPVAFTFNIY
jgi:TonB family protein